MPSVTSTPSRRRTPLPSSSSRPTAADATASRSAARSDERSRPQRGMCGCCSVVVQRDQVGHCVTRSALMAANLTSRSARDSFSSKSRLRNEKVGGLNSLSSTEPELRPEGESAYLQRRRTPHTAARATRNTPVAMHATATIRRSPSAWMRVATTAPAMTPRAPRQPSTVPRRVSTRPVCR